MFTAYMLRDGVRFSSGDEEWEMREHHFTMVGDEGDGDGSRRLGVGLPNIDGTYSVIK